MFNVNLLSTINKTIRFDYFGVNNTLIYAIEMNLTERNQTNVTVKLNYTSFNPDHIKLHTCHNWGFENRKCNGVWEEIPSFGIEGNYVVFNVSHFSAFKIEEEPYCGDGICNNGETCSSCPQDYGSCPEPSGGGSGGSGGGGGSFGGGITGLSQTCVENWTCTEWSECYPNGTQYRKYVDVNHCNTTYNKLPEVRKCNYTSKTTPVNITEENQITGLMIGKNVLAVICVLAIIVGGYVIYQWREKKSKKYTHFKKLLKK